MPLTHKMLGTIIIDECLFMILFALGTKVILSILIVSGGVREVFEQNCLIGELIGMFNV